MCTERIYIYDHVTPILKELRWVRVKDRHELETCTAVFKIIDGCYWYNNFCTAREVTNSVTGQQNCMCQRLKQIGVSQA